MCKHTQFNASAKGHLEGRRLRVSIWKTVGSVCTLKGLVDDCQGGWGDCGKAAAKGALGALGWEPPEPYVNKQEVGQVKCKNTAMGFGPVVNDVELPMGWLFDD